MSKGLGLDNLLKKAETDGDVALKVLLQAIIQRFADLDAKLDQVMGTHAANFEKKVQTVESDLSKQIDQAFQILNRFLR